MVLWLFINAYYLYTNVHKCGLALFEHFRIIPILLDIMSVSKQTKQLTGLGIAEF